jgi:hypothetical protein
VVPTLLFVIDDRRAHGKLWWRFGATVAMADIGRSQSVVEAGFG